MGTFPGARAFVTQSPTIAVGRRRGQPVQFVIQAPTLNRLKDVLPAFVERARHDPVLRTPDAFGEFLVVVDPPWGVVSDLGDRSHVDGMVQSPVAP